MSILSLGSEDVRAFVHQQGWPAYRATQILEGLYRQGAQRFEDIRGLARPMIEALAQHFVIDALTPQAFHSQDGTIKYALTLADGAIVECVWMPFKDRNSLCISSQVGCGMKCAFCVTGKMGLKRNLTVSEIVAQVRFVKVIQKHPVSNIVYMGMGEPLANMQAVLGSIRILTDEAQIGIGKRKITVSTVGLSPKIEEFVQKSDVKLAISLTGSTNAARNHWMPINETYPLEALKASLKRTFLPPGRKFTFEVVLIHGETDRPEDARDLAEFLKGIPAKVNLIPYNENPYFPALKSPTEAAIATYQQVLKRYGFHSMVRENRGRDIMGACGQLAGVA